MSSATRMPAPKPIPSHSSASAKKKAIATPPVQMEWSCAAAALITPCITPTAARKIINIRQPNAEPWAKKPALIPAPASMPVINIPPQLPCNTTKIAPFLPLQQSHCHKRQLRLGINHKKISKDYGIHTTLIKHGLHLNILTPVFFKPLTGKKQLKIITPTVTWTN